MLLHEGANQSSQVLWVLSASIPFRHSTRITIVHCGNRPRLCSRDRITRLLSHILVMYTIIEWTQVQVHIYDISLKVGSQ